MRPDIREMVSKNQNRKIAARLRTLLASSGRGSYATVPWKESHPDALIFLPGLSYIPDFSTRSLVHPQKSKSQNRCAFEDATRVLKRGKLCHGSLGRKPS